MNSDFLVHDFFFDSIKARFTDLFSFSFNQLCEISFGSKLDNIFFVNIPMLINLCKANKLENCENIIYTNLKQNFERSLKEINKDMQSISDEYSNSANINLCKLKVTSYLLMMNLCNNKQEMKIQFKNAIREYLTIDRESFIMFLLYVVKKCDLNMQTNNIMIEVFEEENVDNDIIFFAKNKNQKNFRKENIFLGNKRKNENTCDNIISITPKFLSKNCRNFLESKYTNINTTTTTNANNNTQKNNNKKTKNKQDLQKYRTICHYYNGKESNKDFSNVNKQIEKLPSILSPSSSSIPNKKTIIKKNEKQCYHKKKSLIDIYNFSQIDHLEPHSSCSTKLPFMSITSDTTDKHSHLSGFSAISSNDSNKQPIKHTISSFITYSNEKRNKREKVNDVIAKMQNPPFRGINSKLGNCSSMLTTTMQRKQRQKLNTLYMKLFKKNEPENAVKEDKKEKRKEEKKKEFVKYVNNNFYRKFDMGNNELSLKENDDKDNENDDNNNDNNGSRTMTMSSNSNSECSSVSEVNEKNNCVNSNNGFDLTTPMLKNDEILAYKTPRRKLSDDDDHHNTNKKENKKEENKKNLLMLFGQGK